MPVITLPDGSKREYPQPLTVAEVAASIGAGLAKAALAGRVDGVLVDTSFPIERDVQLAIVTDKDADGLDIIRHSTSHLMAYAVKELFPEAQVTIGPVIENGFYYDFACKRPFTPEDLEAITAFTQNINRRTQQVSLPTPSGSKKFTLSSSAGLASSVETVFKNDVENTRLQLKSNTIPHAYNLAHSLVDKANDRAGAIKVLHELTHFPLEELLSMDPLNYKNYIAKRQGGLRTSTAGWNILLMIDQIITARFLESKFPSSSQLHFDTAPLETSDPHSTPLLRRIISSYNQIFRN